jgi:glycerophosphoryl diester phosphodiesterase
MNPMNHKPLIIAHRGGRWPGLRRNTLEAFEQAIAAGVDMIELDVRQTIDEQLVVFHDGRARGRRVSRVTKKELDRRAGFTVPLFEDALRLIADRTRLDVHTKTRGYIGKVIERIQVAGISSKTLITSTYISEILQAKQLDSTIQTGLILAAPMLRPQRTLGMVRPDFVVPHYQLWRSGLVRPKGFQYLVWTPNNELEMRRLAADHRVAGIITDAPEVAQQSLAEG